MTAAEMEPAVTPALLERIEALRELSKARASILYRCPVCRDQGWVEVNPEGRGTWARCAGPKGTGCGYEQYEREERQRRAVAVNAPQRERAL